MAVDPAEQQNMIDRLMELFQSNEASIDYGNDPQAWVDENLPEGAEPADVAGCMPEVTEQLGGPYQANAGQYNAYHGSSSSAATQSVVNEISYTYNTVYQQNAFIYAEEGAQVTNIQGDGNTVNQVQIDNDYNVEHPPEYYEPEEGDPGYEAPEEGDPGYEDPGYEAPEEGEEAPEDPGSEPPEGEDPGYEEPPPDAIMDPGHDAPPDGGNDAPPEAPADPMEGME